MYINPLPGAKGRVFQLVGSLLDFDPQEARPKNIWVKTTLAGTVGRCPN